VVSEFGRLAHVRFKQLGEGEEPVVGLGVWRELDQTIHVTVRARISARNRPKQREARHTESTDRALASGQCDQTAFRWPFRFSYRMDWTAWYDRGAR
jgi:hypothetical protein